MDSQDSLPYEPGSPEELALFQRWCRANVELVVMRLLVPNFLFLDGPAFDEPTLQQLHLARPTPDPLTLMRRALPTHAAATGASQVAISVAAGGEEPYALLVAVDETGAIAETAAIGLDGDRPAVAVWQAADISTLPIKAWQQLLAANAGYDEFAKWLCRRCESVCPGEASEIPAPCDFCGSNEIEQVEIDTPLRPPKPPFNGPELRAMDSSLIQTVLGTIHEE
jgi:hypothetical protein